MPKFVSKELPEDLFSRLSGRRVEQFLDQVVLLYTVDPDGWPHPAILSHFEVAARDRQTIHLATYQDSHTTANMRRTGRATLSIFDLRLAYTIKCRVTEVRHQMRSLPHNSMLAATVDQVLVDEASREPGVYIATGVTWANTLFESERSWREAVLKELME